MVRILTVNRRPPRSFATALAVGAAMLLGPAPEAGAGALVVTKTADTADGTCDADCSLREAITAANDSLGPDVITVPAGTFPLTLAPAGEDANAGGDLDVTGELTIGGAGSSATLIDGLGFDRVLHTDASCAGVTVKLTDLTIRGGKVSAASGGGITYECGVLALEGVAVTGNEAGSSGGGIYSSSASGSTLTLTDSVVSGNRSGSYAGGLDLWGTAVLTNVTVAGNSAEGEGGGLTIKGSSSQVTLSNVTISGNRSDLDGGGLSIDAGTGTLNNATVTGNTADADGLGSDDGGGIHRSGGTITLNNSIVAGNLLGSPASTGLDCEGTAVSQGHNLIGNTTGCTFTPGTGDQVGTGATPIDPLLGPLADNGGPTPTHALLTGSPAVDAGGAGCAATDQRGAPRSACDIGAYELVLCGKVAVNRIGTEGKDSLVGTAGSDGLLGLGANDRLAGKAGKDALCGGPGKDTLRGGGGKDLLLGQGGKDTCVGQAGRDKARGCETTKSL